MYPYFSLGFMLHHYISLESIALVMRCKAANLPLDENRREPSMLVKSKLDFIVEQFGELGCANVK